MALFCPGCGSGNADAALSCQGCGRPLDGPDLSLLLGRVCRRCDAYNEPGSGSCAQCKAPLAAGAPAGAAPPPGRPPGWGNRPEPGLTARFVPARKAGAARSDDDPDLPVAVEPELPARAALVVEGGAAPGTRLLLRRQSNGIGAAGSRSAVVCFDGDRWLAPLQATVLFHARRMLLRDEGAANGVYLRLRGPSPLVPGDRFVAGERLLRFDGPVRAPPAIAGEAPVQGSPRGEGLWRITELLQGGREGRVWVKPGPVISVGRNGCDLGFPTDARLAARHAEVRIDSAGGSTLYDLSGPQAGVFLRLRERATRELQEGDVLLVGEQRLRIESPPP